MRWNAILRVPLADIMARHAREPQAVSLAVAAASSSLTKLSVIGCLVAAALPPPEEMEEVGEVEEVNACMRLAVSGWRAEVS